MWIFVIWVLLAKHMSTWGLQVYKINLLSIHFFDEGRLPPGKLIEPPRCVLEGGRVWFWQLIAVDFLHENNTHLWIFMNPLPMTIWTKALFQSSNSSFFWPNFFLLVLAQVSSCAWESCGGSGWWTSGLTPQTGGWGGGGRQLKRGSRSHPCWLQILF